MDNLIKYRKRFVDYCLREGFDIQKIRANKKVTVYETIHQERWQLGAEFIIDVPDDTDITVKQTIIRDKRGAY
jgi:hypothetical protein